MKIRWINGLHVCISVRLKSAKLYSRRNEEKANWRLQREETSNPFLLYSFWIFLHFCEDIFDNISSYNSEKFLLSLQKNMKTTV